MHRFLPVLLAAATSAQFATPFFRPDSVSVVSGRVLCGNLGASGVVVEWWADRGQNVDVKLGSAVADFNGNFQVQRTFFSDSKTYLYITNTCGTGGVRQNSRFEVDLGQPSNLLLQLNQNAGNGGSDPSAVQISGRVTCRGTAVPFAIVEWWANQGFGSDRQLATLITDISGQFSGSSTNANGRTYLLVKHNCRGASSQNSRFDINLNAAQNMQLELVRGSGSGNDDNNGISQIGGRLNCNGRRLGNVNVEWYVRNNRGNDQFVGSARTFSDGSFSIRSNRLVDASDSYIQVSHSCGSNRLQTDRFDVDTRRPTSMDIDVRRRNRALDSDSEKEMPMRSVSVEHVDDHLPEGLAVEPPRTTVETVGDSVPEGLAVQPPSTNILYPSSIEETSSESEIETGINSVKIPLDGTQTLNIQLDRIDEASSNSETTSEPILVALPRH